MKRVQWGLGNSFGDGGLWESWGDVKVGVGGLEVLD